MHTSELDLVRVAGKTEAVRIFELIGRKGTIAPGVQEELGLYAQALADYREGNWDAALSGFSTLQGKCDNKALAQVFLDRIRDFRSKPTAKDWGSVYTFGSK